MNGLNIDFNKFIPVLKRNSQQQIFDPIRRKWIHENPEEIIRQVFILYLNQELNYSLARIAVEKQLIYNQMKRRFDLVVYNKSAEPHILIECKAPMVDFGQSTFDQAARYNMILKAPYLCITNGLYTYAAAIRFETQSFDFISALPEYPF